MYQSLFRKYRSSSFSEIIGQEHITKTLRNILKEKRISSAYLFSGPRGTGKTSLARIFAKTLNCQKGILEEPCDQCINCEQISQGEALDVIEIDAASNTQVDKIREFIIQKINFVPTQGRYKIYIIDEAHKLSDQSFNALLKTLEEPPDHVIFILATTHPQELLPTILSRCQRHDFRKLSFQEIFMHLSNIIKKEGWEIEDEALKIITYNADGSLRDALVSLEQAANFCSNKISLFELEKLLGFTGKKTIFNLSQVILKKDLAEAFHIIHKISSEGKDFFQLSKDLTEHYRRLFSLKVNPKQVSEKFSSEELKELLEEANLYDFEEIIRILNILIELKQNLKIFSWDELAWEMALVKICKLKENISLESLSARLEILEKKINLKEDSKEEKNSLIKENFNSSSLIEIENLSIKEIWPKIMQQIKKEKISLHAFLLEAVILDFKEQKLILGYKHIFHKEKAEENKAYIEKIISNCLKVKIQLEFILTNAKETDSYKELINQAKEIFGGELIQN